MGEAREAGREEGWAPGADLKNGRDGGAPRDLGEHALVVDPRGVVVAEHRELARYLQLVGRRVQADERHVLWESRAEKKAPVEEAAIPTSTTELLNC